MEKLTICTLRMAAMSNTLGISTGIKTKLISEQKKVIYYLNMVEGPRNNYINWNVKDIRCTYKQLLEEAAQFHLPSLTQLQGVEHNLAYAHLEDCYGHILSVCHLSF